ncbi:MAG: deoxyribodipyrimidine photo-lyase, partial [Congregibacter sp.]|nr:deoxyribodipyrimidine photo-lyase [Congregibacter sp.]
MRAIYWFRNNLRLHDHPGLIAAAAADELLLVYLWPKQRPWCNIQGIGEQRERFIAESLGALAKDLQPLGQNLLVLQGSPELVMPDLVRDYGIDAVHTSQCPGSFETRAVRVLRERLDIPVLEHEGNTLFKSHEVAALCPDLPDSFSPFRRKVEKSLTPAEASRDLPQLPGPPAVPFHRIADPRIKPPLGLPLRGGSDAGQRRLKQFLQSGAIRQYKETRNCLDPLEGSSTLSPWLALGSLSAREVAAAVREHEAVHGSNESTYWLIFELLWRDYFFFRALRDGVALFRHGGRQGAVSR